MANADRILATGMALVAPAVNDNTTTGNDALATRISERCNTIRLRPVVAETGHDAMAAIGQPTALRAKVEYGHVGGIDVQNATVEFFVDGKSVGSAVADADGIAELSFAPDATGRFSLTYEVRVADRPARSIDSDATLFVTDSKPAVVVDLDGFVDRPAKMRGLQHALAKLEAAYDFVYITSRDDHQTRGLRRRLARDHDDTVDGDQRFPPGPLVFNDHGWSYDEAIQLDKDHHAQFKTQAIKKLALDGVATIGGISIDDTGRRAFRSTGLDDYDLQGNASNLKAELDELAGKLLVDATSSKMADRLCNIAARRNLIGSAALNRDLDILTNTKASVAEEIVPLIDGDQALPRFLEAFAQAKENIIYRAFEFHDDKSGNIIAKALIERAKAGVRVVVHIDGLASKTTRHLAPDVIDRMRRAGVEVVVHNPFPAPRLVDNLHRDHRKMISVDGGRRSFIGGMNTGEHYLGDGTKPTDYHDVFLDISGPAARDIYRELVATYERDGGSGDAWPDAAPTGDVDDGLSVRIVNHFPKEDLHIKDAYIRMIDAAQQRVFVQNSFPVHADILDALKRAIGRGVEVHYVYGRFPNESGAAGTLAEGGKYRMMSLVVEEKLKALIAAGGNVYQLPRYSHAKAMSVDGQVASVGSSNMDNFALDLDREAVAIVSDEDWVTDFDSRFFEKDIALSRKLPTDFNDAFWTAHDDERAIRDAVWPEFLK